MFRWLKKKVSESPTAVMTAPGVLKVHNVEAKFHRPMFARRSTTGKLSQDRWSDGQERFRLVLRHLPRSHDGKVRLLHKGEQISEFDVTGSDLKFHWKGYSNDDIPLFAIGDQVTITAGSLLLNATVQAD